MGKILYVEDELKVNDIIFLFNKYLSDEERDILATMQKERRQRRENIKKLLMPIQLSRKKILKASKPYSVTR